jgi:hypothetical protein
MGRQKPSSGHSDDLQAGYSQELGSEIEPLARLMRGFAIRKVMMCASISVEATSFGDYFFPAANLLILYDE